MPFIIIIGILIVAGIVIFSSKYIKEDAPQSPADEENNSSAADADSAELQYSEIPEEEKLELDEIYFNQEEEEISASQELEYHETQDEDYDDEYNEDEDIQDENALDYEIQSSPEDEEEYFNISDSNEITQEDLSDDNSDTQDFAPEEYELMEDYSSKLRSESSEDALTGFKIGLANETECQNALIESTGTWAVAKFDIDRFRFINSIKGVSIGDYVLTNIANILREEMPEGSLCTRIGADHFSVLFPVINDKTISEFAHTLKSRCEKIRSDIGSKSSMRLCMGIAKTGGSNMGRSYDVLLAKADIASQYIKNSKNELFAVYESSMIPSYLLAESAMNNYSDFQYEEEEIVPYFMPQSNIVKNRIVASQALIRWNFEEIVGKERLVTPVNGRLPSDARRLFYMVCRTLGKWKKGGKEKLPVFVYLPETELFRNSIDEMLAKCLEEFQLDASYIIPVVPITAFEINREAALSQLVKISEHGIKIAVDGNVHRNNRLDLLKNSGIDYVKIPPVLSIEIHRKKEKLDYLSQFQSKILSLGYTPILEGIDETSQMKAAEESGCHLIEGHFSGRAVNAEGFNEALKEFVKKQRLISRSTVVLDEDTAKRGDFNI